MTVNSALIMVIKTSNVRLRSVLKGHLYKITIAMYISDVPQATTIQSVPWYKCMSEDWYICSLDRNHR